MSFFHVIVLNYCIPLLHADAIGDDNSKKSKIEPFLNLLLVKFQSAFYPGENLSLDEMVIKWKGRSKYKMYNPNKPEKYHIKTFGLCDSLTGYAYNLLIYFGAETSFDDIGDTGQSEKIFHSLLKPLGTGHHLFADRYYTTHKLTEYLIAKKTYYTGTLMANRKNFPNEIKSIKMQHMESKFYRSFDRILCCVWKDKKARKPVIAVSTYGVKGNVDVSNKRGVITVKPTIIHDYNLSMNGCDRMDQMLSYYNAFNHKTVKWWKRIFIWSLEVAQVHSYILVCLTRDEGEKPVNLLKYKKLLVNQLLAEADTIKPLDHKQHKIARPNILSKMGQK